MAGNRAVGARDVGPSRREKRRLLAGGETDGLGEARNKEWWSTVGCSRWGKVVGAQRRGAVGVLTRASEVNNGRMVSTEEWRRGGGHHAEVAVVR